MAAFPATHPSPRARLAAALLAAAPLLASLGAGCATLQPLPPYERGHLQARCMREPVPPLEAEMTAHVLAIREAIAGGTGSGGASCGCN